MPGGRWFGRTRVTAVVLAGMALETGRDKPCFLPWMIWLWTDSLMWGEGTLCKGLGIVLCHPESALGIFGGQCPEKTLYQLSWHQPLYSLIQNEVWGGIQIHPQIVACLNLGMPFSQRGQYWVKLPCTFRPTIFLKFWYFGKWIVLSMIYHLTKKLLKNIKLWRRKHGFCVLTGSKTFRSDW